MDQSAATFYFRSPNWPGIAMYSECGIEDAAAKDNDRLRAGHSSVAFQKRNLTAYDYYPNHGLQSISRIIVAEGVLLPCGPGKHLEFSLLQNFIRQIFVPSQIKSIPSTQP